MRMVRTYALPLLATLVLGGCGLESPFERLFTDDEASRPSSDESCQGIACGPCAPALTLHVTGAPGQPRPQATLVGISGHCGEVDAAATQCLPDVFKPGSYAFQVQAPGYETAHVEATVPAVEVMGCCSCGYEPTRVDVVLTPSEG